MIESLKIIHYRKLKDITLTFSPGINIISGTNGTCKSSILHLIGNAFQLFKQNNPNIDKNALRIIKAINKSVNPKVENLTKGDKMYNNPAYGTEGELFKMKIDGIDYPFRRHNTQEENPDGSLENRFRLILKYPKGKKQSLPFGIVLYLGLSRIVPIGELNDNTTEITKNLPPDYQAKLRKVLSTTKITTIAKNLPPDYQIELVKLYKDLTSISIQDPKIEDHKDLKYRIDFKSETEGVDSNTISAGEDNIMIILTALVSLKYHFETCTSPNAKHSILLIDEFDATLHPSLQFKLFKLIERYASRYQIQIFFTTHSLYLLNIAFKARSNIIYLKSAPANRVKPMDNPDIYQVQMHLNTETGQDVYANKKIPIFTEDKEGRKFTQAIFEHFSQQDSNFAQVSSRFHFSTMSAGCENLKSMFKDEELCSTTLKAICILDGDNKTDDKTHHIMSLPGGDNPEQIAFKQLAFLTESQEGDRFWDSPIIQSHGLHYDWVKTEIMPAVQPLIKENYQARETLHKALTKLQKELNETTANEQKIKEQLDAIEASIKDNSYIAETMALDLKQLLQCEDKKAIISETIKKLFPYNKCKPLREAQKDLIRGKIREKDDPQLPILFELAIKDWIVHHWEDCDFKLFRENLSILFKKVAPFHNINPETWTMAKG